MVGWESRGEENLSNFAKFIYIIYTCMYKPGGGGEGREGQLYKGI